MMDNILVDGDQIKLDTIKNQAQADLNNREYSRHETRSDITKGTKRNRSESNDSNSSREDNEFSKSRNNIRISSVLVRPNRAIETADSEEKRRAILESQRNDKQVFDRNRRMFGMLMGTLKQFKSEETTRERSTVRRNKVEEQLELAVEEEKVNLEKEEDQVREERQQQKDNSEKDELRQDIIERFKNWESTHRQLCSYIQTETKPKIFWLPKEFDSGTEKRLKESKDYFSLCVAERAAKLKKELEELDNVTEVVKTKGPSLKEETIDKESEYHSSSSDIDRK